MVGIRINPLGFKQTIFLILPGEKGLSLFLMLGSRESLLSFVSTRVIRPFNLGGRKLLTYTVGFPQTEAVLYGEGLIHPTLCPVQEQWDV